MKTKESKKTSPVSIIIVLCVIAFAIWLGSRNLNKSKEANSSTGNTVYDFSEKEMKEYDTSNLKLNTGKAEKLSKVGGVVQIIVKTDQLMSNKMTIEQNYLNVDKLIKENGFNTCPETLRYIAHADAADGTETEIMHFTVNKSTITDIFDGKVDWLADLPDQVEDLWVHPDLLK